MKPKKKLHIVYADIESFWSKDHSLSKMNPIVYCLHPLTQLISCSIKVDEGKTRCFFGEDKIKQAFDYIDKTIGLENCMIVAHNNSGFDAMIFAWRLKLKPRLWGCTLAMARPIHAKTIGLSLAKLVEHYEVGRKNNAILLKTQGKRLEDFTQEECSEMSKYNCEDTDQGYDLFKKLYRQTPADEMRIIDQTIRMLVEPQFEVDVPLLEKTLAEEIARKNESLMELAKSLGWSGEADPVDFVKKSLASSAKFAQLLTDLDVEVPMKPSPSVEGKEVPALSKTDEAFIALQNHPRPLVAAAARARLDVKSTMLESRITSFLEVSQYTGGIMPIALNYYGADTTGRWSGAMGLNQQNLPRIGKKPKPTDALRNCLRAPAGYKVVVADLSGIELRVNHFLWKVPYSMALFQADPEKADLYKYFAAHELYHIAELEVNKDQRQIGKISHLGLGFGAGAPTFRKVAKVMGGVDLAYEVREELEGDIIHFVVVRDESKEIVDAYRAAHPEIVQGWKTCHESLRYIADKEAFTIDPWGMCVTCEEGIRTPKGLIRYPSLREEVKKEVTPDGRERTRREWVYGEGRHKARIYAGKVTENIVQHLARCVIADNALEIRRVTGYNPKHTVHDELIYIVPESEASDMLDTVQGVMRTPPKWWPELVTWSEGSYGDTYGEAK